MRNQPCPGKNLGQEAVKKLSPDPTTALPGAGVPHFSRCLREVGLCADILPTLSQRSADFLLLPADETLARAWAYREL